MFVAFKFKDSLKFSHWAYLSESMQADVIGEIRKRRGLDPRPPSYEEYYEKE
jgi:hypothetical protein